MLLTLFHQFNSAHTGNRTGRDDRELNYRSSIYAFH